MYLLIINIYTNFKLSLIILQYNCIIFWNYSYLSELLLAFAMCYFTMLLINDLNNAKML